MCKCKLWKVIYLKNADMIYLDLQVVEVVKGGNAAADVNNGNALVQGESANNYVNSSKIVLLMWMIKCAVIK